MLTTQLAERPATSTTIPQGAGVPTAFDAIPRVVAIWDLESDGLLERLTRVHVLAVQKIVDGVKQPIRVYRCNQVEDTIREGLDYLADSDMIVGHNILGFDLLALAIVYPEFYFPENLLCWDTEVLARMLFSSQRDKDFVALKRNLYKVNPGSNELGAWGERLNVSKGDYAKVREAKAKELGIEDPDALVQYVWGEWNEDMDDYAGNDIVVTTALWEKIVAYLRSTRWPLESVVHQHASHDLMVRQQHAGFGFDAEKALILAEGLKAEFSELTKRAIEYFGTYAFPAKIYKIGMVKRRKGGRTIEVQQDPRKEFGEDNSRESWGEVVVPRTRTPEGRMPGWPCCPLIMRTFKPTSRLAIVNRLKVVHNWVPTELTEAGSAKVSDDILRPLGKDWPICEVLADIFFYQKMIGMVYGSDDEAVRQNLAGMLASIADDDGDLGRDDANDEPEEIEAEEAGDAESEDVAARAAEVDDLFGASILDLAAPVPAPVPAANAKPLRKKAAGRSSAWLLNYKPWTGGIHHRCVVGAANSRRATHSGPNLGQVKGVEGAKDGDNPNSVLETEAWTLKTGGEWELKKAKVRTGRLGNFGWECRELFRPMPGMTAQVGIDLTGIEMRALGARLAPYDDGEFLRQVTTPGIDVHILNAVMFGLASPDDERTAKAVKPISKRCFYAMVYGSGDLMLGSIVCPAGTPEHAMRERGKALKDAFFKGRPAFAKLDRAVKAQARRGYLIALDGGRLQVRSEHSAINLQLQSDGALIAQKWITLTNERLMRAGLVWQQHYSMMAYVHDESQYAAIDWDTAYYIGETAIQAATDAGEFYNYVSPVAAEAKVGRNWAECH